MGVSLKDKFSKLSGFLLGKHDQKDKSEGEISQKGQVDEVQMDKTDPGSRLQQGRASRGPFGAK